MSEQEIICPRCKTVSPPDTEYCQQCGEVLGQRTRDELQRLATVLRALDKRIAANQGSQTVAQLHSALYVEYQDLRRAPWLRTTPREARLRPAPVPFAALQRGLADVPVKAPEVFSGDEFIPPPAPPVTTAPRTPAVPMAQQRPVGLPRTTAPLAAPPPRATRVPAAPAGPAFSWQAFAADQAIAIMIYLGGFLGLIATLTLVISPGDNNRLTTLAIVTLIYAGFCAGGFGLRRVRRMRTVSSVYLAVFALMTPLVALAVYRYQLQQINFPVAAMLCLSAFYATIVYLGLAVQTRFATYAYLGWVALIVGALAIIPWLNTYTLWWVFDLGVVTLALLAPHRLRHHEHLSILAEPAVQVAAVATVPVVIGVQFVGIIGLWQTVVYGAFPTIYIPSAALALAACIQVPITFGWRATVPSWQPRQQQTLIDFIDGFNAVFFAEAIGGVTIWIASSIPPFQIVNPMAVALAGTALLEFGLALWLHQRQPQRRGLRYFLEVLAVLLAGAGAYITLGDALPNQPLLIALSAALVVSVGAALIDGEWWLLVSGFFLLALYYNVALLYIAPNQVYSSSATLYFAMALALWALAMFAGVTASTRRFAAPIYVVALCTALYTTLAFLGGHDAGYQTQILLTFTAAVFSAGLRERQPAIGSVVTGLFGLLAVLPLALRTADGLPVSLLALGLTLAALAVRRFWGTTWAISPYVIALWAVVAAAFKTSLFGGVPDWTASGLPFTAWFLLVFAAIAFGVALWENAPVLTIIPALLAFWGLRLVTSDIASVALVFVLIAAGAAAREARGRAWGVALQVAAAAGSIAVTLQLNNLGPTAPNWQVVFLLGMAIAAYLVAVQEREPAFSVIAVIYALAAVYLLPGPSNLLTTLDFTFGFAGLGAIHRLPTLPRLFRREWSYAPYAAAVGCSVLAITRVVPFNGNEVEGLLLVFAAVSYMLVALEGAPLMTFLPALYAMACVFLNPDEHALLPLALGLALLGLIAGRAAGMRWAWSLYAASALAAVGTIASAQNDSHFQALALLILAAVTYLIAAIESRPDVLLAALVLGLLTLSAWAHVLGLAAWESTLAFLALGWLYTLVAPLWETIPWLRATRGMWWTPGGDSPTANHWRNPRATGALVHRAAGLTVVTATALVSIFEPGAFDMYNPQTLAVAIALLGLAGMLVLTVPDLWGLLRPLMQQPSFRLILYFAGMLVTLAVTWTARWIGADNVQAYVLAPGTYLLIVGAFLPADRYVPSARRIGQFASLSGSLVLLLPTLYQTFTDQDLTAEVVYGTLVLLEALVIIGLGVGTHTRPLILMGAAFIVIDTISAATLALQKGVSIGIIIGGVALVLIILATWLSLRTRQQTGSP